MKNLIGIFLLGRLALGLWEQFPPDQQQVVLEVMAQELLLKQPDCVELQIIAASFPNDNDYAYFFGICLKRKEAKKNEIISSCSVPMWKN